MISKSKLIIRFRNQFNQIQNSSLTFNLDQKRNLFLSTSKSDNRFVEIIDFFLNFFHSFF